VLDAQHARAERPRQLAGLRAGRTAASDHGGRGRGPVCGVAHGRHGRGTADAQRAELEDRAAGGRRPPPPRAVRGRRWRRDGRRLHGRGGGGGGGRRRGAGGHG